MQLSCVSSYKCSSLSCSKSTCQRLQSSSQVKNGKCYRLVLVQNICSLCHAILRKVITRIIWRFLVSMNIKQCIHLLSPLFYFGKVWTCFRVNLITSLHMVPGTAVILLMWLGLRLFLILIAIALPCHCLSRSASGVYDRWCPFIYLYMCVCRYV